MTTPKTPSTTLTPQNKTYSLDEIPKLNQNQYLINEAGPKMPSIPKNNSYVTPIGENIANRNNKFATVESQTESEINENLGSLEHLVLDLENEKVEKLIKKDPEKLFDLKNKEFEDMLNEILDNIF